MRDYATLSIETHLFFARIMKEHALFLEAGFPCCEKEWIEEAEHFRKDFEELLRDTLKIAEGNVHEPILNSNELVTEFTIPAEERTESLSGIPIDSEISRKTHALCDKCGEKRDVSLRCGCSNEEDFSTHCGCNDEKDCVLHRQAEELNERAHKLLDGLIRFKERILCKMKDGQLYTSNYPLLIEHIMREAMLYRDILDQLMSNRRVSYQRFYETETFWNQIMMEHAWFIRGLLDPSEAQLIETADDFSKDYAILLEKACRQDYRANALTAKTLEETLKYRDFKAAGTKGILDCEIASIILPLLADHVLREANHYIRVLETGQTR
ncbi:MAG: DUF2935 domain-containing protein [Lachnospiraceae bacterium]|nr:DUF2935 domain-containing protein [Lachnospiraceae bacterium]